MLEKHFQCLIWVTSVIFIFIFQLQLVKVCLFQSSGPTPALLRLSKLTNDIPEDCFSQLSKSPGANFIRTCWSKAIWLMWILSSLICSPHFSFSVVAWDTIPSSLTLSMIISMIATDLPIEEENKRGIKHFSFLNSSVTFSSICYWFYYWVWLWLTSLLLIQCNALSSLVPTCLYSFILILITLSHFHFLTAPLLRLRILDNICFN